MYEYICTQSPRRRVLAPVLPPRRHGYSSTALRTGRTEHGSTGQLTLVHTRTRTRERTRAVAPNSGMQRGCTSRCNLLPPVLYITLPRRRVCLGLATLLTMYLCTVAPCALVSRFFSFRSVCFLDINDPGPVCLIRNSTLRTVLVRT